MAESSRRPVTKVDVADTARGESLEAKVERLEEALSRIAVMCGQGNLLSEYGIERWQPGKEHMNKYKS